MSSSRHYSTQRSVRRYGDYDAVKTIGEGEFGKVKVARHTITREKVAVKIINKAKLKDDYAIRNLSREIEIMKRLRHPNIIQLFEVVDQGEEKAIVMEYAKGGEVFDYIVAHGRLHESIARKIFRQLVSAIEYCHELKIVHRDLKAENLLLDDRHNVKLIDFGLSNNYTPGHALKTYCGSPSYVAPELLHRRPYEGPEVDCWALGVLLFALVCGHLPFRFDNLRTLYRLISKAEFTVGDHVSPACRDLIHRILVVDVKQRFSLREMAEHPWTCKDYPSYIPRPIFPTTPGIVGEPLNQVLSEMQSIGFDPEVVIRNLRSFMYNRATATYLLIERKLQLHPKPELPPTKPLERKETPVTRPSASSARSASSQKQKSKVSTSAPVTPHGGNQTPTSLPPIVPIKENEVASPKTPKTTVIDASAIEALRTQLAALSQSSVDKTGSSPPPPSALPVATTNQTEEKPDYWQDTFDIDSANSTPRLTPIASPIPTPSASPSSTPRGSRTAITPEPRTVRFAISVSTTSSKDPFTILHEIKRVLTVLECTITTVSSWCIHAALPNSSIEVELHGVRVRRRKGNPWSYKQTYNKIVKMLDL